MPKINKPSFEYILTRVCLGKRIITPIISIEHIIHMPAVSLGTAGACDIVKHKSFSPIMPMVLYRPENAQAYNGLTSPHCR